MRAPTLFALTPLILATAPAPAPPPAARVPSDDAPQAVSVAAQAGPEAEAARRLLLQPYANATATTLGVAAWDGTLDALKALQTAHQTDLVLATGPVLAAGCRAQLLDRLDWSSLGRDRFVPAAATDCGAGAYLSATVMAWDRDKVQGAPGWPDFWDVAKHPGRRGLRRAARGNLEIALMADGVAVGDVYRTLRSSDGVDRAFRKLDQLKPYILWWDQPAQAAQLLEAAKVLLTSAQASTLPTGPRAHLAAQWTGSLEETVSWARPVDAPHGRGALAAIQVASDAARQAGFARETRLGPATRTGFALLPAEARAQSPTLPANLQAGLTIDESFWLDNGDKLEARFAAWVGK